MTAPIWIDCESLADVGSPAELARRVKAGRHLVLGFASLSSNDETALIARLSEALPDHAVFVSGGAPNSPRVTIMSVVTRARVLERRTELLRAIDDYRQVCAELAKLYKAASPLPEWRTDEHGGHCWFENKRTGQIVEVPVQPWVDPARVDPFFFAKFVKTTPGLERVAELIDHDFHDAAQILKVVAGNP